MARSRSLETQLYERPQAFCAAATPEVHSFLWRLQLVLYRSQADRALMSCPGLVKVSFLKLGKAIKFRGRLPFFVLGPRLSGEQQGITVNPTMACPLDIWMLPPSHSIRRVERTFLSAHDNTLANIAIYVTGVATSYTLSAWCELIVGLGIAAITADAAVEV
jgi:hypothetical protein